MFKKFRIITISIALSIWLIFIIISSFIQSSLSNKIIQKNYERFGESIASSIRDNIWSKYYPIIGYLQTQGEEDYTTFPQFNSLIEELKEVTNLKNLYTTKIHLNNGKVIEVGNAMVKEEKSFFSNLFSSDFDNVKRIKKVESRIIKSAQINQGITDNYNAQVIKVFVPLHLPKAEINNELKALAIQSDGVLELDMDITENISSISWLVLIAIILTTVSIISTAVMFFVVSLKADKFTTEEEEQLEELIDKNKHYEQNSKEKAKFIAKLGHELRTPLNAIIGFAEIMKNETMGKIENPQYKEFVADIHSSGQYLLDTVNNLLDSTKSEENLQEIEIEEVDFTKLVKENLQLLITKASEKHLNIIHNITDFHLIAKSSPQRLKQIMTNILSSIMKGAQLDTEITIKLWHDDDKKVINLTLSDNTTNYSEEDLEKINSGKSEDVEISLSKKVIELLEGKLRAATSDKKGVVFFMTFPLIDAIPPLATKAEGATKSKTKQEPSPMASTEVEENLSDTNSQLHDNIEENSEATSDTANSEEKTNNTTKNEES